MSRDPVQSVLTLLRFILLALVVVIVMMASKAKAEEHNHGGHEKYHSWYNTLKSNAGASCCNSGDCQPSQTRVRDGKSEALFNGQWLEFEPDAMLKGVSPPDGGTHACKTAWEAKPRCVIIGTGF